MSEDRNYKENLKKVIEKAKEVIPPRTDLSGREPAETTNVVPAPCELICDSCGLIPRGARVIKFAGDFFCPRCGFELIRA